MKKLLTFALAGALSLTAVDLARAPAAEARCVTIKCFNRQDTRLKRQVRTLRRRVGRLYTCLQAVPVTQYGDPAQDDGYLYDPAGPDAPFPTTALDVTSTGDAIHAWFVIDSCQTQTVARRSASRALDGGLLRPLGLDPQGERK